MSSSNASHRGITEYGKNGCETTQTQNQQHEPLPPTGTTGSTFGDCISFSITPRGEERSRSPKPETMTYSNNTEHGEDQEMDDDGRPSGPSTPMTFGNGKIPQRTNKEASHHPRAPRARQQQANRAEPGKTHQYRASI